MECITAGFQLRGFMSKKNSLKLDGFLGREIRALSRKVKTMSLEETIQAPTQAGSGMLPFSPGLNQALQDILRIRSLFEGKLKESDLLRHVKQQKKSLSLDEYSKYLQTMQKNLRDLQKQ
jgi:hypothetical protein